MLTNVLELIPAYGRTYSDPKVMMQDWEDGKDFKIVGGPYCSIRDLNLMRERGFKSLVIVASPQVTKVVHI